MLFHVASSNEFAKLFRGLSDFLTQQYYDARRQRVLGGRSPEEIVRQRLAQDGHLANPVYHPPPDPCVLPKALLVIERAKDVPQPDS